MVDLRYEVLRVKYAHLMPELERRWLKAGFNYNFCVFAYDSADIWLRKIAPEYFIDSPSRYFDMLWAEFIDKSRRRREALAVLSYRWRKRIETEEGRKTLTKNHSAKQADGRRTKTSKKGKKHHDSAR